MTDDGFNWWAVLVVQLAVLVLCASSFRAWRRRLRALPEGADRGPARSQVFGSVFCGALAAAGTVVCVVALVVGG